MRKKWSFDFWWDINIVYNQIKIFSSSPFFYYIFYQSQCIQHLIKVYLKIDRKITKWSCNYLVLIRINDKMERLLTIQLGIFKQLCNFLVLSKYMQSYFSRVLLSRIVNLDSLEIWITWVLTTFHRAKRITWILKYHNYFENIFSSKKLHIYKNQQRQ